MSTTITGVTGTLPLPNTCTVPVAGELVEAAQIAVLAQQLQNQVKRLEDNMLPAPGGVRTGDLEVTGDLDVGDDISATNVAATGNISAGGGVTSTGNINAGAAVHFTGTQPASNADPGARNAYDTNQVKAWAVITTDGAGNATIVDGYNISSVAIASGRVDITFVRAFATATYAPSPTMLLGASDFAVGDYANSTASKLALVFFDDAGASIAPALSILRFAVNVTGRQ